MAVKQCRFWWPDQLLTGDPSSDLLLFGWFFCSPNSVDAVVAFAISPSQIPPSLDLQEIFRSVNAKMPLPLQESATFCMLGQCALDCCNRDVEVRGNQHDGLGLKNMQYGHGIEENAGTKDIGCESSNEICLRCNSGCDVLNHCVQSYTEVSVQCCNWIRLSFQSGGNSCEKLRWIPEFCHMHHNGHLLSDCRVHHIIYEVPTYGRHHFCVSSRCYSEKVISPFKRPAWFNDLHRKSIAPNLETVVLAVNCADAAVVSFEWCLRAIDTHTGFRIISRLVSMLRYMLAVCIASISTAVYVVLQLVHCIVKQGSLSFFQIMLRRIFTQTWICVHIRSCQLLYWPISLLSTGFREQSKSNIEYAHKAALRKHSMWSNIAMDVIMGITFGVIMLVNIDDVYSWVSHFARNITNNLLRSGCVWMMGVPAGFKLNTELAELLGMVSLNVVQIFSTLWFFTGSLFLQLLKGFAVSGIFLGLTVPIAMCIDLLKIATLHIWIIYLLISFMYSRQIQALASLWRLFRGRKWNPLRQRLDSYDYTVEQHVVGSLLFTPLLLLLPTTSVFYIFFTILSSIISFISIILEITIGFLHATPYADILLWVFRKRRFPAGIWFEISSGHHGLDLSKTSDIANGVPETVVSILHSNYATLGQVVAPNYRNLLQRLSLYFGELSASGVLSGQRNSFTLQVNPSPTTPWMQISCREYWRLCYHSVLGCRSSQRTRIF